MEEDINLWQEAEEMVQNFKKEFTERFKAKIDIYYNLKKKVKTYTISLVDIVSAVNEVLHEEFIEGYVMGCANNRVEITNGVLTKTRVREIIIYRHILFYLARNAGYGPSEISRLLGTHSDHATIIHGNKRIKELVEIKDKMVLNRLVSINNRLHSKVLNMNKNEE
jgi:chromosomal replication initiation ATPase DnaA